MAAEKGEKMATSEEREEMGVKAGDEEVGAAAEGKGAKGPTVGDEDNGATAKGKGTKDSTALDGEDGAKAEVKGKRRESDADEKGATADWGWEWKFKGATAADGEEDPKPRRERRRWRSTRRERGAEAVEKEQEATAAAKEVDGENTAFVFSAPAAGKTITLVSLEGQPFKVSEKAARQSVLLADMIDNGCAAGNIPLPNVDARALATVIKYCDRHATATAKPDSNHGDADGDGGSSSASTGAFDKTLAEWDCKLVQDLTQDALFDLIGAANFLDIKGLLETCCQKVADVIKSKTPAQVRAIFGIANDFTAEEEAEIRNEHPWAFE